MQKRIQEASTQELRSAVREVYKKEGIALTQVVYMNRRQCIEALSGRGIFDITTDPATPDLPGTTETPETPDTDETETPEPDTDIEEARKAAAEKAAAAAGRPTTAPDPQTELEALAALKRLLGATVDANQVREIVNGELATVKDELVTMIAENVTCRPVKVEHIDSGKIIDMGIQHEKFDTVLKIAARRRNIWLVGEAGSGKTTLAHNIANALELPFYLQSVCEQTTKTDLIGYRDVNGNFQETPLLKAFQNGGVFLMDEADAANTNTFTVINSLIANGMFTRPDGQNITRHKDFIFMAAANTYGRGANKLYVGRNQIDAATLNRFVVIVVNTDEVMEHALASNKKWCLKVQKLRAAANELKEKIVVSQRATLHGAEYLADGFSEAEVAEMTIFQGINPEIKNRVIAKSGIELAA